MQENWTHNSDFFWFKFLLSEGKRPPGRHKCRWGDE